MFVAVNIYKKTWKLQKESRKRFSFSNNNLFMFVLAELIDLKEVCGDLVLC